MLVESRTKRMRMFVYINADDIEKLCKERKFVNLGVLD